MPCSSRRPPAERLHDSGQLDVAVVAEPPAVLGQVAGILQELVALDVGGHLVAPHRRKDRYHRANSAVAQGQAQMVGESAGDLVRIDNGPEIANLERLPMQPADAARVVAPGNPGAEGELLRGVLVGVVPPQRGRGPRPRASGAPCRRGRSQRRSVGRTPRPPRCVRPCSAAAGAAAAGSKRTLLFSGTAGRPRLTSGRRRHVRHA